jgi:hypothetical protein
MGDVIECDGCGRSFATEQPAEMLAAIKGPCPTCGGTFRLAPVTASTEASRSAPAVPRQSR